MRAHLTTFGRRRVRVAMLIEALDFFLRADPQLYADGSERLVEVTERDLHQIRSIRLALMLIRSELIDEQKRHSAR